MSPTVVTRTIAAPIARDLDAITAGYEAGQQA